MSEEPKFVDKVSEQTSLKKIGNVVMLSGEKPWVVISHFEPVGSNIVLIGLCDGANFKYEIQERFMKTAKLKEGNHKELVRKSMKLRDMRNQAYEQFEELQADGTIAGTGKMGSWEVRKKIHAVFKRCIHQTEQSAESTIDSDHEAYIRQVRRSLCSSFYQPGKPVHERPLLNGKLPHFCNPTDILTIDIEGTSTEIVSLDYIQAFIAPQPEELPSTHAAIQWLMESGIHPLPYRAKITKGSSSLCNAYDLKEIQAAQEKDPYISSGLTKSEYSLNQEGSALILDEQTGKEQKYWYPASFAEAFGISENENTALVRLLKSVFPNVIPLKVDQYEGARKCLAWPEEKLLEICPLFLDKEGIMNIPLSEDDEHKLPLSTIGKIVPSGTDGAGVLIHELEESTNPITLHDIRNMTQSSACRITIVKKIQSRENITLQKVELGGKRSFFLFVRRRYKSGQSEDQQSVVLVGSQYDVTKLEPARKFGDLKNALQAIKAE